MKIAGVILIIAGIRLLSNQSYGTYDYQGFGIGFIGFGVFCFALEKFLHNMNTDK